MFFRRRKKQVLDEVLKRVNSKNMVKRYTLLLVGCLVAAFAFNLFFLRYNIVCFGVSGISIVLSKYGIDPSVFIMLANAILIIVSYFFLGIEDVKNQLLGAIIYPVFVDLTANVTNLIDLGNIEFIIIAIMGGVLAGVGFGLIYKSGFSTGGTDVIGNLICKYSKTSMGNAMLFVDTGIIILGKIAFSWKIVMYAIVVAYLISMVTDKILLGISSSKAFYIVTSKDKAEIVREFLISLDGVGCTIINAFSGYDNDKKTLLLAVVPSRMHFLIKEGLKEIDKNIFYLVCDSYEVSSRDDNDE